MHRSDLGEEYTAAVVMIEPSKPEKVTLERARKCKNAKHIKRTLKRNIESNQDCLSFRGLLGNSLFATTVDVHRYLRWHYLCERTISHGKTSSRGGSH